MPELAVLIPTRGRPGNIRKVISAWDFTNAWGHADMVLLVDADDPEIGRYHDLENELRHPDTGELLVKLYQVPKWLPMVHKLDAAARELAPRYRALGFAGDDHLPRTIGWAERYLTVLLELGTGMVYGDDGYQGAKLSTEWAITSDVVRELGRMVPAPVEHMYCDNSMMDLFGAAGALRHLPEVRIEHMHPVVGKAETDEQYKRVNHRDQFKKDRAAYEGWRGSPMAADVGEILALRRGLPEVRPEWPERLERKSRVTARLSHKPARPGGTTMKPPRFFKRVRGATPEDVMVALADFASQVPADQEIVELGVFHGRTALQMAWGARQGRGAHVTGIDPWSLEGNVYDPPFTDDASRRWANHWISSLGYSKDIRLIQGFSQDVAETWDEVGDAKSVGLLYVDGDHTKEGAKLDIVSWAPHLAPGAIIAVDDYGHPDWPGVAEAVDELVAEGFLAPIELYHDRLAVTRLTDPGKMKPGEDMTEAKMKPTGTVTAITSEGVASSPYPAMDSQVADGPASSPEKTAPVKPFSVVERLQAEGRAAEPDTEVSIPAGHSVMAGELGGVPDRTPIESLNLGQLRSLAKHRGIVLGKRKDLKAEILQALRDGE